MRAGEHRGSPGVATIASIVMVLLVLAGCGAWRPSGSDQVAGCAEPVGDRIGDSGRGGHARCRPPPSLRGRRSARRRSDDAGQPARHGGRRSGPGRPRVGRTPPASGRPQPLGADDPAEPGRRASVGSLGGHGLGRPPVLFEPADRRRVRARSAGAAADHHHVPVRLGAVACLHLRVRLSGLRVQPAGPVRVITDSRRCRTWSGTARLRRRSVPRWPRGPSRSPVRECVAPPRVRRGW